MIYTSLKCGEVQISRVSIGGNIFGHFADEKLTADILSCAKSNGINFIDTSDSYSRGISEEFIGRAISKNREWWIVATKCGLESNQLPNGLGSKSQITCKLNESLRRLKTDYLDIYQMHNFDPITPLEQTVGTLEECVREGKIRYYGVSNYSPIEMKSFCDHVKKLHSRNFISGQYPFNLLKQDAQKSIFPECIANGVAVLAYGVLARGLLTSKYLAGEAIFLTENHRAFRSKSIRSDLTDDVILLLRRLNDVASNLGITLSQLAMKYALSTEAVATAIVGVRDICQLNELIKIVNTPPFQVDFLDELENISTSLESNKLHLGGILRG